MNSAKYIDQEYDIIQQTRYINNALNQQQRFRKAKRHFNDALNYRHARNDIQSNQNQFFQLCYHIQVSYFWSLFLFLLTIVYMYLIIFEPNNRQDLTVPFNKTSFIVDIFILILLCLDIIMEIYHKKSWKTAHSKKFPTKFYFKVALISLLIIDDIIFYSCYSYYPIRPFRILRSFLPYFYDYFSRKALISLIYAYQDIIVFIILHTIIMVVCGIIGTQIINIPPGATYDQFNSNYNYLPTMIFLTYVLSSYDSWPDYELLSLQYSQYYYIFYVTFIFLNCFYFVTIPTTMYFSSFKVIRSKILLIDEIKQQNSLLLCFICLGEQNLSIKSKTFHQFMLYLYKNKIRYFDYIKQLSYKLDPNNNDEIFISDFMRLCKIIEKNEEMRPPSYQDRQYLIKVRKYLNNTLGIKKIVRSDYFQITILIVIVTNICFILVSFFGTLNFNEELVQDVYLVIYSLQVIFRLIAVGPQKYVKDNRNLLDLFLVLFAILFKFIGNGDINVTLIQLSRLIRIVRFSRIVSILSKNTKIRQYLFKNIMYKKLRILIAQLIVSMTIGVRMFPIFMTVFYCFGIIGIESFDNRYAPLSTSPYIAYDAVSNYRSFTASQLANVQIMIQAGWSVIVFDTAYRFKSFGLVIIFFILNHIFVVIVMVSWMKGLVGDLYGTIKQKYEQIWQQQQDQIQEKVQEAEKLQELREIKILIDNNQPIKNDTIMKKQLCQNKLDRKLIQKLQEIMKQMMEKSRNKDKDIKNSRKWILVNSLHEISKKKTQKSIENFRKSQIKFREEKQEKQQKEFKDQRDDKDQREQQQHKVSLKLINQQQIPQQSIIFEEYEDLQTQFLERIQLQEQGIPYSQSPLYPKDIISFLKRKLVIVEKNRVRQLDEKFDINNHLFQQNGVSYYTNQLQSLLQIKKPEKQRKKQILQDILKMKITDRQEIQRKLRKQRIREKIITSQSLLNQIYLNDTNPDLIKKFQIQYFSDIYGQSFRQLNRVTLQPMLKHESFLVHSLMRLLRYPTTQINDFFSILATIQIKISESLLKIGSIFKFVFEVEGLGNNWFSVEVTESKQLKIHFLKSGIWIYNHNMKSEQIYYANDIFLDDYQYGQNEFKSKEKIIRLLYNSFQTLAFSMLDETNFFNSDPADNVYDLYSYYTQTNNTKDKQSEIFNPYEISKVMIIILSKQNERTSKNKLKYGLTNLKSILQQKKKKKIHKDFKFDDDENVTYDKLKNLAPPEQQKIISSQGLPFAYLIDMMKSIEDLLKLYKNNLVIKAQKALKEEFMKCTN